jgi:hypothetical protein
MNRLTIEELLKAVKVCHGSYTCPDECPILQKGGHEGDVCVIVDSLVDEHTKA